MSTEQVQRAGKIFGAIIKVKQKVGAVAKTGAAPAKMGGYAYRKFDDIANAVSPLLDEFGVIVNPRVVKVDRGPSERMSHAILTVEFDWIAVDGSMFTSTTIGEAFDSGDKANIKAQTVAYRTVLAQVLNIPFEDMVDPEEEEEIGDVSERIVAFRKYMNQVKSCSGTDDLKKILCAGRKSLTERQIEMSEPDVKAALKRVGLDEATVEKTVLWYISPADGSGKDAEQPEANVQAVTEESIREQIKAADTEVKREVAVITLLRGVEQGTITSESLGAIIADCFTADLADDDISGFLLQEAFHCTTPDSLSNHSTNLNRAHQTQRISADVKGALSRYGQKRLSELTSKGE